MNVVTVEWRLEEVTTLCPAMACRAFDQRILFQVVIFLLLVGVLCRGETGKSKEKKTAKIGKDITDYTDADVYRLLDQWDVSTVFI